MKSFILIPAATICLFSSLAAQDTPYPSNPKPGMCYIRCVEEDLWKEKTVQITKIPGYTQLERVPAVFEMRDVQILVKEASKKLEVIPAVYKTVTDTFIIADGNENLTVVPLVFTDVVEDVITQPAFARFETKSSVEACDKKDPRDCEVLCYVEYPEQKTPISVKKISTEANYKKTKVEPKIMTYKREVLVTPAQVREIEIPAVYKTIKKRVLVRDDTVKQIQVPPQYENVTTRVLEKQGSVSSWVEISCKLTDPNVLPIYYDLNSARLTPKSRNVIDEQLYNLMVEKPRIRIEISSHTDSRESDDYNMELSQRRAQSVVDYLVSKGIKAERLVAKGYGESRLREPCPNNVPCSEEQHSKNRRTEFRVLTN
jgi:outer membrane protein OmpA-like peptidoglycan-associated protein